MKREPRVLLTAVLLPRPHPSHTSRSFSERQLSLVLHTKSICENNTFNNYLSTCISKIQPFLHLSFAPLATVWCLVVGVMNSAAGVRKLN